MNKVIFMGRLTADPERKTSGDTTLARFNLAVDRRGGKEADFFSCTAFGKTAEIVCNHLLKGSKILLEGRVQNNNYTDREGRKVYGTQIIADSIEFADSKKKDEPKETPNDGFMQLPDNVDDEELPFN